MLLLVWLLRGALDGLDGRRLSIVLLKTVAAGAAMTAVALGVQAAMQRALPGGHFAPQAARLAASIGVGLVALAASAGSAELCGFDEFDDVRRSVSERTSGTKVARSDRS